MKTHLYFRSILLFFLCQLVLFAQPQPLSAQWRTQFDQIDDRDVLVTTPDDRHWIAYDYRRGLLYKFWRGEAQFDASVATPNDRVISYLLDDPRSGVWEIEVDGKTIVPELHFLGYEPDRSGPTLHYELILPNAETVGVTERVGLRFNRQRLVLERSFSVEGVARGSQVQLDLTLGATAQRRAVQTNGKFLRRSRQRVEEPFGRSFLQTGTLLLRNDDTTRFSVTYPSDVAFTQAQTRAMIPASWRSGLRVATWEGSPPSDDFTLQFPAAPDTIFIAAEPVFARTAEFRQFTDAFYTYAEGFLHIETAGSYDLQLIADDAAELWLDGERLLRAGTLEKKENPPITATTQRTFEAGYFPLVLRHTNAAGGASLQLATRRSGTPQFNPLPLDAFYHDAASPSTTAPPPQPISADAASLRVLARLPEPVSSLAFDPTGEILALTEGRTPTLYRVSRNGEVSARLRNAPTLPLFNAEANELQLYLSDAYLTPEDADADGQLDFLRFHDLARQDPFPSGRQHERLMELSAVRFLEAPVDYLDPNRTVARSGSRELVLDGSGYIFDVRLDQEAGLGTGTIYRRDRVPGAQALLGAAEGDVYIGTRRGEILVYPNPNEYESPRRVTVYQNGLVWEGEKEPRLFFNDRRLELDDAVKLRDGDRYFLAVEQIPESGSIEWKTDDLPDIWYRWTTPPGQRFDLESALRPPLLNRLSSEERAAGWRLWFDGKTLRGWTAPAGWEVQKGEIRGGAGTLFRAFPAGDFTLEADIRVAAEVATLTLGCGTAPQRIRLTGEGWRVIRVEKHDAQYLIFQDDAQHAARPAPPSDCTQTLGLSGVGVRMRNVKLRVD